MGHGIDVYLIAAEPAFKSLHVHSHTPPLPPPAAALQLHTGARTKKKNSLCNPFLFDMIPYFNLLTSLAGSSKEINNNPPSSIERPIHFVASILLFLVFADG